MSQCVRVVLRCYYNAALVNVDRILTEEIYYWHGRSRVNLEDWDGAAQDLRQAHLLNSNFSHPVKNYSAFIR
jgi:hypothetical protein